LTGCLKGTNQIREVNGNVNQILFFVPDGHSNVVKTLQIIDASAVEELPINSASANSGGQKSDQID